MMTTELTTTNGHALAQTTPGLALADIRQWAEVFLASRLFKDTTDLAKAVVKIQYGQEIGVGPFAAMDGIDIIDGRPAPNAGLIAALIKRSGRYNFRVLEASATGCRLQFTDRGEVLGEVGFTTEDAKRAGLTAKQNWTKWPEDMMFARALTRGARRFCADVFMGSVYTPEELAPDLVLADPATGEVLPATVRQLPPASPPEPKGHDVAKVLARIDALTDLEGVGDARAWVLSQDDLRDNAEVLAALDRARNELVVASAQLGEVDDEPDDDEILGAMGRPADEDDEA